MAETKQTKKLNLYEKLIEVRKTVLYLKKDNKGYGYDYVSSSQTIGSLRKEMDVQGVLLVPSVIETKVADHKTRKDNHEYFTELKMHFTWINAENPEERIECDWYGQGLDDGEKGPGKALTYAEKYFLLKFFNIATDKDDPDANQLPPGNGKTPEQTQPKSNKQQDSKTTAGDGKRPMSTEKQQKAIYAIGVGTLEWAPENLKEVVNKFLGKNIKHTRELTAYEASQCIDMLNDKEKAWAIYNSTQETVPEDEGRDDSNDYSPEEDDLPF